MNETRFEARWRLGQLLAKIERRAGRFNLSRTETNSFRAYLKQLGLDKSRANECQRIAAIPADKLDTSKNLVVTGGWGWFGSAEARSVA